MEHDRPDKRLLEVRVIPRSSNPRVEQSGERSFRVHLASAPEKGKANTELLERLAAHLGVRKQALSIVRGASGRDKRVKVEEDAAG